MKWLLHTLLLAFAVLLFIPSPVLARKWTDITGKFSVEAELLGLEDGKVILKTEAGKTIRVPVEKLSSSGRAYLVRQRKFLAAQAEIAKRETDPKDFFPDSPLKIEVQAVEIVDEYPAGNVAIEVKDDSPLKSKKSDAKLTVVHVRITAMRSYNKKEEKKLKEIAGGSVSVLLGDNDVILPEAAFLLGRFDEKQPGKKALILDQCWRVRSVEGPTAKRVHTIEVRKTGQAAPTLTAVTLSKEKGPGDIALVFPHQAGNVEPLLMLTSPYAGERILGLRLKLSPQGKLLSFDRYESPDKKE